MVIFSPAGVNHAVFCKLEALTEKLNLEEKTYLITETGAKYTRYCVNSVSLYHFVALCQFSESSFTRRNKQKWNQFFELFKYLLNNLDLPENIYPQLESKPD